MSTPPPKIPMTEAQFCWSSLWGTSVGFPHRTQGSGYLQESGCSPLKSRTGNSLLGYNSASIGPIPNLSPGWIRQNCIQVLFSIRVLRLGPRIFLPTVKGERRKQFTSPAGVKFCMWAQLNIPCWWLWEENNESGEPHRVLLGCLLLCSGNTVWCRAAFLLHHVSAVQQSLRYFNSSVETLMELPLEEETSWFTLCN